MKKKEFLLGEKNPYVQLNIGMEEVNKDRFRYKSVVGHT